MASYTYQKLDVSNEEIRLISLIPGKADDDILSSIFHAPLIPPQAKSNAYRPSLEEVEQTLPEDWTVQENLEGRYLFIQLGTSGKPNSWTHPDPSFDNSSVDFKIQQPLPDFEPKYDALSYPWGLAINPVTAHILDPSSKQHQTDIQIGSNLACALRHLRYNDQPRTLWIDAVCINQSDMDERNAQVKRMGMIYSLARKVVIWLGPEADDSTHAISTLVYFGKQVEYFTSEKIGDSPGATEPKWWNPVCQLPYDERTWSSLVALFRRPWFSRVWVLQEALLANQKAEIQCGDAFCPWTTVQKAIQILPGKAGVPREVASSITSYRNALLGGVKRSFTRLMLWATYRHCTDPRDKVYGVLSLLSPLIQNKIEPQYSIPMSQVYMTTFLVYLNHVKRLELLDQCTLGDRCDGLPSWVPNWAISGGVSSGHIIQYVRQPSGLSAAHAKLLSSDTLEVVGKRCARISSVNSSTSDDTADILAAIRLWEPEGLQTKTYVSGGSLLDAFLEVVVQGRTRERCPYARNFPTLAELRKEYQELLLGNPAHGEGLSYLKRFSTVHMLSLLTTREGYLGVGSQGAKEGDFVCVLLGCNRPKLLRETASGDFLVVGDCFFHGLMDAESLLGPLPVHLRMELLCPDGFYETAFYNASTKERSTEDARLPSLSPEWEITQRERTQDDPFFFREFKNLITGETLTSDPRMLPGALEQRGVTLDTFRLV
ncbi:HET-domain-containing protein [Lophium mytilinum]|uniref:HET-domain-containing protein n=1 Tax=Lophium mytilinum TaxID=390894 RepID=A0A6A6QIK3_9PEZI|nr:HET-domain-containing protein [Lophium mytilinum]